MCDEKDTDEKDYAFTIRLEPGKDMARDWCPFCGDNQKDDEYTEQDALDFYGDNFNGKFYLAKECSKCGANGPAFEASTFIEANDGAEEKWAKRECNSYSHCPFCNEKKIYVFVDMDRKDAKGDGCARLDYYTGDGCARLDYYTVNEYMSYVGEAFDGKFRTKMSCSKCNASGPVSISDSLPESIIDSMRKWNKREWGKDPSIFCAINVIKSKKYE